MKSFLYVTFLYIFVVSDHLNVIRAASSNDHGTKSINSEEEGKNGNKDDVKFLLSSETSSSEYDNDLFLMMDEQHHGRNEPDQNWDVLIFTQQWPVTTCYHWREQDKNHECKLPTKKEFWTIHGIWPTKLGHIGPNFCNKTADFDVDQLKKIAERLQQYWPDIDGETDQGNWLWKHEWLKHGTCAALLEELDNELKYFGQGLLWRDKYLISRMFDDVDIHPDSNNTVIALNNALVRSLGRNPSIHCLYDSKNDISYLAEIRICFNKSLDLIDCDGVKLGDAVSIKYPGGNVNTNCHISIPVHYPSLVPTLRKREQKWKIPVVNIYKFLQFVMWFTL